MRSLHLDRATTALLVVDVQERLWSVMREDDRAQVERNLGILVATAKRLGLPIVVSEQYKKGLGPTIASVIAAVGEGATWMEKLEFSCAANADFAKIYRHLCREQWIVCGMEAHVCVYQTARDLAERGAQVHVPADAVISRTRENRQVGLGLIERAGGVVTSTEVVVFDALVRAEGEDFKALSKLVR
jgi:nicotinamidase-related amidase